ncbi:32 kDa beta-galactoside-binding lectin-like [Physella acuta]|uniref:32 kDa beta-galactoside-binding lectin-like n=1 Tax=Physella acuta TaxID=109671 RepID=UPI0027DD6CEC|nr:32 kDa beta-galactoside-binding lectin-like [Physella acuta]
MFKLVLTFFSLLASFWSVHGGDSLQMTNLDNGTFQHQTKRSSSQYGTSYTDEIRHPMADGKEIHIEGTVKTTDSRFTIELCEKQNCLVDIEFQADIRFNTRTLVMNYKRNLQFGQATIREGIPLTTAGPIQIKIVINPQQFKIYLNKTPFTFTTVVRWTKLKYIRIRGTTQINWILYSPRMVRFNDQLAVKRVIIIGTPNSNNRFSINLKNWNEHANRSNCTYGNVALHIDVRFFQSRVIIDSKGSKWTGEPSVLGRAPFAKDLQFKLQITIRKNRYEILFDDGSVFNWAHLTEQVDMVCINQDLTIKSILTT